MNLKDKKVLITGATGGIGYNLVKKFSDLGAVILATGTNKEKLVKLQNEFKNIKTRQFKLDEHSKIAGLYINRLKKGMKLQADPTVKFALNKPGLRRLYYRHLEVDSPYNTYKFKGLPPGPIWIPDKRVIDAVLDYESHDYIFMCAQPSYSGYHNFSSNNKDHEKYKKDYTNWLSKEGIN